MISLACSGSSVARGVAVAVRVGGGVGVNDSVTVVIGEGEGVGETVGGMDVDEGRWVSWLVGTNVILIGMQLESDNAMSRVAYKPSERFI